MSNFAGTRWDKQQDMEWNDDAIVLSVRPHGETSAIVETLTREHGRHTGLVRGGASRRVQAVLQPGNTLHAQWRARLSEHLGNFSLELSLGRAGAMIESRDALLGLNAFTSVASAALPEREAACAGLRRGRDPARCDA